MTVPTALLVTSVAQEEEGDMVAVVSDFVQFAAPMEKPAAPLRTRKNILSFFLPVSIFS